MLGYASARRSARGYRMQLEYSLPCLCHLSQPTSSQTTCLVDVVIFFVVSNLHCRRDTVCCRCCGLLSLANDFGCSSHHPPCFFSTGSIKHHFKFASIPEKWRTERPPERPHGHTPHGLWSKRLLHWKLAFRTIAKRKREKLTQRFCQKIWV